MNLPEFLSRALVVEQGHVKSAPLHLRSGVMRCLVSAGSTPYGMSGWIGLICEVEGDGRKEMMAMRKNNNVMIEGVDILKISSSF